MTIGQQKQDEIKDRIRKLLNLANNAGAMEGEIENAMMFANKLMAQYHLNKEDLNDEFIYENENYDTAKKETLNNWAFGIKISLWESHLAGFVRDFIGSIHCAIDKSVDFQRDENGLMIKVKGEYRRTQKVIFYGLSDDVRLANTMYEEMQCLIAVLAKMKYGTVLRGKGCDYACGFVSGLCEKLTKSQKVLQQSSSCTALVVKSNEVIVRKKQAVTNWIRQDLGLRFKKTQARSVNYNDAFLNGKADGVNYSANADMSRKNNLRLN